MARSKKPRKAYVARDFRGEAARLRAREAHFDKPAEIPAAAHETHSAPSPRASAARGRYLVPVAIGAGAVGGGAYLAHRMRRRNHVSKTLIDPLSGEAVVVEKRYLDDEFVKDDSASGGRRTAAGLLPGYHGAVAGRKGKKLRSAGNEYLGAAAGVGAGLLATRGRVSRAATERVVGEMGRSLKNGEGPGRGAMRAMRSKEYGQHAALTIGTGAAGAQLGVNRNQNRGYYKSQVGKGVVESHAGRAGAFVPGGVITSVTTGRGSAEARPGTRSHANKLSHTTHRRSRYNPPRGTLVRIGHGRRSVSGSSVGKMYVQDNRGYGQRLTNI